MNKIHFYHVRPVLNDPHGGLTIAAEVVDGKVVAAADARCHPRDNYNKRVGRAKAGGRLKSDRYRHVFPDPVPLEEFSKGVFAVVQVLRAVKSVI